MSISFSALQTIGGHATSATECDVTFPGTNTTHKQIAVIAIWHGSTDSVVLTCEDTLHNWYTKDNGAGPISSGSHSKANMFFCVNGRPGASAGDCTIKIKSGSDVGDFVVLAVELDGGSGNFCGFGLLGFDEFGVAVTDYSIAMGVCNDNPALLFGGYVSLGTTGAASEDHSGFTSATGNVMNAEHNSSVGSAGMIWTGEVAGMFGNSETMILHMNGGSPSSGAAFASYGFTGPNPSPWRGDTPVISPSSRSSATAITVSISEDIPGLDVYYTTDGSTPDNTKTLYTGPFSVHGAHVVVKAIAIDSTGFWADSIVDQETYEVFTGHINNPNNIIDGDDTTFAELVCDGASGDVIAAAADMMGGTLGASGNVKIDYEVTQNDLVAPGQTLDAIKVSVMIGATEHVLDTYAPGAGPISRQVKSQAVSAGALASTLKAKVKAVCDGNFATGGGLKVRVYGAYLQI